MVAFDRLVDRIPGSQLGTRIRAHHFNDLQEAVEGLQTGALPITPLANMRVGVANVLDYGAVGDGVTDDTAAIQAAIDTDAAWVEFPHTSYRYLISEPIEPKRGQLLLAKGGFRSSLPGTLPVRLYGPFNGPNILLPSGGDVTVDGLWLQGNGASGTLNDIGILADASGVSSCSIRNVRAQQFGGPAIKNVQHATTWEINRCLTGDCVLAYAGLSDYLGAVDLMGTDHYITNNEFGANGGALEGGYSAAFLIREGGNLISNNVFEISEVGCVVRAESAQADNVGNSFLGNRADLNKTHGFIVQGQTHLFVGNKSHRNSTATDNTYDGFSVDCETSTFIGSSFVWYTGENEMRYGFNEISTPPTGKGNFYTGSVTRLPLGTALYNLSSESRVLDFAAVAPTYTPTNVSTDRSFNANSTSTDELADVLGTLIADLQAQGILS